MLKSTARTERCQFLYKKIPNYAMEYWHKVIFVQLVHFFRKLNSFQFQPKNIK